MSLEAEEDVFERIQELVQIGVTERINLTNLIARLSLENAKLTTKVQELEKELNCKKIAC